MVHEMFMQRAIELAQLGAGAVAPNPMVGCVIVHQQQIIAEGWHQQFGQAHAEVNALKAVEDKSILPECTLYVTLEPCSHYGKTPPCANAIKEHGIKKVVIGSTDPNPLVSGRGINLLRDAGIEVMMDVCKVECDWMNRRFMQYMQQQTPYVILKWAESADGFIAPDGSSLTAEAFHQQKQLTGPSAQLLNHKWRAEEAAILVGTNTALIDNPSLTTRHWSGKNPTRLVLDLHNRLPEQLHLFNTEAHTYCFTYQNNFNSSSNKKHLAINPHEPLIPQILRHLYQLQLQSVIVEGGTQLLNTFVAANAWQEARVFTSPKLLHQGIEAPKLIGTSIDELHLQNDILRVILPQ
jgi:diaminohydroxyphosphoribosylaminopyrimidine deaminase/5-amino-6-(5-phosphoribosylamino)uracil reductase